RKLQPVLHPPHTELVPCRNQARTLNLKSALVKAPTGHTSTTLTEYGLSKGRLPVIPISEKWPRLYTMTSLVWVTFRVNRTHRVHRMQRSRSSFTRGPSVTAFVRCVFSVPGYRLVCPACSM